MALTPYETLASEPLAFPIGGKLYTVPPIEAPDGFRLSRIMRGEEPDILAGSVEPLWRLILGTVYDEMLADSVPIEALTRAGTTALADFQYGRKFAEITWETGGDPESIKAHLAAEDAAAAEPDEDTPKLDVTPEAKGAARD